MSSGDLIRVFVGADRSQLIAVKVLEYSIKRHTSSRVEVIPMIDLEVPQPKDPRNSQRTGFSFSRFCIPKLTNYVGKAIYLDADMLVFKDIRELWDMPFNGAKVLIQKEVKFQDVNMNKENAPPKRIKQCSVMLLDCGRLPWDISAIVKDMDEGRYDYEQLMYELCILQDDEINYSVPFEWNSLEYFDEKTCLIHYTDMRTQPWVSSKNLFGEIWLQEVRRMIADGSLSISLIKEEIRNGHFRPSLLRDIRYGHLFPRLVRPLFNRKNEAMDVLLGYKPHRDVYRRKNERKQFAMGLK